MMQSDHGGDIYALDREVLDLSVDLNPLGPPPCVGRAVGESAALLDRYPDPQCRRLRRAIAAHDGVPESHILCGNGASDLICCLAAALRPRRALITAPTFSEYEKALSFNGCKVFEHYTKPAHGFDLTDSFLSRLRPGIGLVFLCTPNNPTGRLIDPPLLRDILARCREIGALLAVDECFLPLSDGAPDELTPELEGGGLLLLRALTKTYAMPGLRLGYALCADRELLARMERAGPPWPVSIPAQAAGAAALTEAPDWASAALDTIRRERSWLTGQLSALGLQVVPSQGSFLLFRAPGDALLREKLLERGILIRACGNFHGLGPDWYRIAVPVHEAGRRLIDALIQIQRGEQNG